MQALAVLAFAVEVVNTRHARQQLEA